MRKRVILICLGLVLYTPLVHAQKITPLDSLREIIIEYATDTIVASKEEESTVKLYLKYAQDSQSTIDIILAYQQLAAISYRQGHINNALLFYRLYVLEQQQLAEKDKKHEQLLKDKIHKAELETLRTKIEELEGENKKLKMAKESFIQKNNWISLGLKILGALIALLLLGWLYQQFKKPKKKTAKEVSPSASKQLAALLETTKQALAKSDTEHDLSDILVQQIMPQPQDYFSENKSIHKKFLIHQPKKLASGDGLFFFSSKHNTIMAVFDAPGYGATGGLLCSLINSQLNDLVRIHKINAPDLLLSQLELALLKQFPAGAPFTGGISIGICLYNASRKVLSYSAANMELFIVQKGIKHSIHGSPDSLLYENKIQEYELMEVDIVRNTNFYLCTDGYWKQHGGHDNQPFGKNAFEKAIESLAEQPIIEHEKVLSKIISDWKGGNEQDDDILILGFGF